MPVRNRHASRPEARRARPRRAARASTCRDRPGSRRRSPGPRRGGTRPHAPRPSGGRYPGASRLATRESGNASRRLPPRGPGPATIVPRRNPAAAAAPPTPSYGVLSRAGRPTRAPAWICRTIPRTMSASVRTKSPAYARKPPAARGVDPEPVQAHARVERQEKEERDRPAELQLAQHVQESSAHEEAQTGHEGALDEEARGRRRPRPGGARAIDLREHKKEAERQRRRVVCEGPEHGAESLEDPGGEGARRSGAHLLGEAQEVVLVRGEPEPVGQKQRDRDQHGDDHPRVEEPPPVRGDRQSRQRERRAEDEVRELRQGPERERHAEPGVAPRQWARPRAESARARWPRPPRAPRRSGSGRRGRTTRSAGAGAARTRQARGAAARSGPAGPSGRGRRTRRRAPRT